MGGLLYNVKRTLKFLYNSQVGLSSLPGLLGLSSLPGLSSQVGLPGLSSLPGLVCLVEWERV